MSPQENRKDIFQLDASLQEIASGVVAIFDAASVKFTGYGKAILELGSFPEKGSPFYQQPVGAVGTGFLVTSRIIVTANHIIETYNYVIDELRFIFGFQLLKPEQDLGQIDESEIYFGKLWNMPSPSFDWALIELNGKHVPGAKHRILNVNKENNIKEEVSVFTIGHPLGLPAKFAGDACVTSVNGQFFDTDLKINIHNSGSPVFNEKTKKVEGIVLTEKGTCFKVCQLPDKILKILKS